MKIPKLSLFEHIQVWGFHAGTAYRMNSPMSKDSSAIVTDCHSWRLVSTDSAVTADRMDTLTHRTRKSPGAGKVADQLVWATNPQLYISLVSRQNGQRQNRVVLSSSEFLSPWSMSSAAKQFDKDLPKSFQGVQSWQQRLTRSICLTLSCQRSWYWASCPNFLRILSRRSCCELQSQHGSQSPH